MKWQVKGSTALELSFKVTSAHVNSNPATTFETRLNQITIISKMI